ncbi:midnolin homolog isoform X2 [Anabrus simplex]
MDGSRLTLLPSVETGLLAQRPEQSVMQALESLNDSQVNDFLSGKAPLNLTMRLGDHMMLIQLQLSTVTPSSSRRSSPSLLTSSSRNSLASSLSSVMTGSTSATAATSKSSSPSSPKQSSPKSSSPLLLSSSSSSPSSTPVSTSTSTTPQPPPLIPLSSETRTSVSAASTTSTTTSSSRFKFSTPLSAFLPKPMETSPSTDSKEISPSTSTSSAYSSPDPAQVHTPRTTVPVSQSPLKSLEDAANLLTRTTAVGTTSSSSSSSSSSSNSSNSQTSTSTVAAHSCSSSGALTTGSSTACKCEPPAKPTLDTRALAEASRNLTQTLKQLSSEVLTSRSDPAEDSTRSRRQGAIIESMHHHGKGVYSGTFSGTLNPALQDRFGRPKRDISTIIHILNDLLCATPQYRRHARQGHTITVEASSSNTQKQNSTTNTTEKTQTNMDFMDESGSLSRENQATRGKMEHLRLIMEERRARRRARREARAAPYTTQWSAKSESVSQPATMGRDAVEPMETGEQSTGSEQQLCELNPPEPVVA